MDDSTTGSAGASVTGSTGSVVDESVGSEAATVPGSGSTGAPASADSEWPATSTGSATGVEASDVPTVPTLDPSEMDSDSLSTSSISGESSTRVTEPWPEELVDVTESCEGGP